MKKIRFLAAVLSLSLLFSFAGCTGSQKPGDDTLRVVASIFPPYDFARQIGGDHISLTMLLRPGTESHSYEPTAADMIALENCDILLCAGGEGEQWVQTLLSAVSNPDITVIRMMDCVPLVEESSDGIAGNGHENHGHSHEEDLFEEEHGEYDEHVWASPVNAGLICDAFCNAFCRQDPENAGFYQENLRVYRKELSEVDALFWEVVSSGARKEIVVGDRFPFRYLAEEYGLRYAAAFPGCASDTGASASSVAALIEEVRRQKIPVVFHIEFSNHRIADAICEETGASLLQLHSCHNLSAEDFAAGVTYTQIMRQNAENLRLALG